MIVTTVSGNGIHAHSAGEIVIIGTSPQLIIAIITANLILSRTAVDLVVSSTT